ncbi:hypothetical protein N4Q68_27320 [Salmonella enterica subsp. enterica serovar Montevideo]
MPLALFALTISAFAIGTTEFVIVGLVPTIAQQLAVSLPSAGMLVSIYALGVAIGYYDAKFFLRPHFQLEGLTGSLRLVTKLPSVKQGNA